MKRNPPHLFALLAWKRRCGLHHRGSGWPQQDASPRRFTVWHLLLLVLAACVASGAVGFWVRL